MSQGFSNAIVPDCPPGESTGLAADPFVNCSEGSSTTKKCPKCDELKPATTEYFCRDSTRRDGLRGWCKTCTKNQCQRHYKANGEVRERNRESYNEYMRKYRVGNPEKMREYGREQQRKRYQDVGYRVSLNISHGMWKSLREGKNGRRWETLVGYTLADLMAHLEAQFTKGMTWENYGSWHIHHVVPQSWFHFESYDDPEFKTCWALNNLQPLWAFDNLSKNNRMVDTHTC